jgi:hypothetical protein
MHFIKLKYIKIKLNNFHYLLMNLYNYILKIMYAINHIKNVGLRFLIEFC